MRTVSEYRCTVSLISHFYSRNLTNLTQIEIPCDLDKRNGNELFVCSKHSCMEAIVNNRTTEVLKQY